MIDIKTGDISIAGSEIILRRGMPIEELSRTNEKEGFSVNPYRVLGITWVPFKAFRCEEWDVLIHAAFMGEGLDSMNVTTLDEDFSGRWESWPRKFDEETYDRNCEFLRAILGTEGVESEVGCMTEFTFNWGQAVSLFSEEMGLCNIRIKYR